MPINIQATLRGNRQINYFFCSVFVNCTGGIYNLYFVFLQLVAVMGAWYKRCLRGPVLPDENVLYAFIRYKVLSGAGRKVSCTRGNSYRPHV